MDKTLLNDEYTICQIFGGILKNNDLIFSYGSLEYEDFVTPFARMIFTVMRNFAIQERKITAIEIDQYISQFEDHYKLFNSFSKGISGLDYLDYCEASAVTENFDKYVETLKKFTYLRACLEEGIDVTDIFNPTLPEYNRAPMVEKFNTMTLDEIQSQIENKFIRASQKTVSESTAAIHASENLEELLESLSIEPDYGLGLLGGMANAIHRGARLTKFYLLAASSNVGKSRYLLGNACALGIGKYYDVFEQQWVVKNDPIPTLYISTEMELEEVQTMIVAHVSGVSEDKILEQKMNKEEIIRVQQAVEIIAKSSLYIEIMMDFDINDIKTKLKKYKAQKDIVYVFFDYLHSSIKLIEQIADMSKGMKLREDQVLYLFSVELKNMANQLNIFVFTATQSNRLVSENEFPGAESMRGSFAVNDKSDYSSFLLNLDEKRQQLVEQKFQHEIVKPNVMFHIFKNRSGKYKDVVIFSYFDKGTLQIKDLMVCRDYSYEPINIEPIFLRQKELAVW